LQNGLSNMFWTHFVLEHIPNLYVFKFSLYVGNMLNNEMLSNDCLHHLFIHLIKFKLILRLWTSIVDILQKKMMPKIENSCEFFLLCLGRFLKMYRTKFYNALQVRGEWKDVYPNVGWMISFFKSRKFLG
jgi:hypothetical protein